MTNKYYLSTAIPYVNSVPHVGFALELVLGDAIARHRRARGDDVLFQGGTDDNSLKNVRAAEAAGRDVLDFVADNRANFQGLAASLGITFDTFVSTSSDPRHRPAVERLWRACHERGDLYRKRYEGLYCLGCEGFYDEADLVEGCCPEHAVPPERISEGNWFFQLSAYRDQLLALVESRQLDIVPDTKRNEVLATLRSGIEDISVSRSSERARGWGIPVPGDPSETIYVWLDALANYISGAGYGSDDSAFARNWTNAPIREHLVGKGITRFHAIYWPAFLLSAGIALPTRILVHGYLTVEGRKIGKSSGNGIEPGPLVARYGRDAVRWYLLRHVRSTHDGDFSEARLVEAHNADLADQLGNLVNRTLALVYRRRALGIPEIEWNPTDFGNAAAALGGVVSECIKRFELHEAAQAVIEHVADANRYIVENAPWSSLKAGATDPVALEHTDQTLGELVASLRTISICLDSFIPDGAARLRSLLDGDEPGRSVLFPKIAIEKAAA